jgi:hypothetical protein
VLVGSLEKKKDRVARTGKRSRLTSRELKLLSTFKSALTGKQR